MARFKKVWTRLGRPEAIGWPVGVVFFLQVFFGSYAASFTDVTGRLLEFTGARVVSILAMVAALLLGRAALNTFAHTRPQPVITLVTIMGTVIIGASVQNGMLIALGFTDTWNIAQRVIVAGPGLFTLLTLTSLVVVSARESARTNSELADKARQLQELAGKTQDLALLKREQLLVSVRQEIDQAVQSLSTTTRASLRDDLNGLLDDVIRPMSYRLAKDIAEEGTGRPLPTSPKISWSDAFRGALQTNPAHPTVTTLWLGILVGTYLVTSLGLPGVFAAVFSGVVAWVCLFLVKTLWPFTRFLTLRGQAVVYSGVIAAYSSGSAIAVTYISGYNLLLPHSFTGFVLLSLSMAWTISLIYGLSHTLDDTHATLDTLVSSLQREVISLNNDVRILQKNLSRVLHGPIQSTLLALIRRLDPNSTDEEVARQLATFRTTLESALMTAAELNDTEGKSFDEAIDELIEFWRDVTSITLDCDVDTQLALASPGPCARALIELTREACGNAIKHGRPKHIAITLRQDIPHHAIRLTIDNDGSRLQQEAKPGGGSRLFDESCLTWRRYQAGPVVRVEALVPVLQQVDPLPIGTT